ncbi:hypothetical protein [Streptomyces sirii]|uniref:hypothetical protein n=1 Tax=Streptomyces sirii TaxID=3127701 RepID=UPI003D3658AB
MHIRHIPLYALAAGALAVTLLLFGGGDGEGADAATGAVTDAVKGAVKGAVRDAVSGAGPASDGSHPVVVEPATVAPGAAFTVSDGDNCRGESAEAGFGGADIPALPLTPSTVGPAAPRPCRRASRPVRTRSPSPAAGRAADRAPRRTEPPATSRAAVTAGRPSPAP